MAIDLFDIRAPQKPSFVHPLRTGGFEFDRSLGVLSNMTTSFNVAFEYPAHITSNLEYFWCLHGKVLRRPTTPA